MRGIAVRVRLAEEADLEALELEAELGPPEKHRSRFLAQQRGEVVYLVAWDGTRPVGHLLLAWAGTPDEPIASRLDGCPDVEDLLVLPDYRRRGIGSELMAVAESLARGRGYHRIGLGVATQNHVARALYDGRGYVDSGFGEYPHDSCVYTNGHYEIRTEICVYLIKPL